MYWSSEKLLMISYDPSHKNAAYVVTKSTVCFWLCAFAEVTMVLLYKKCFKQHGVHLWFVHAISPAFVLYLVSNLTSTVIELL